MKRQISNVSFDQLNSSIKGYKEFKVSFLLNGKNASYFTFVKEKKGINYLTEAKKAFDADVKSGRVNKAIRRSRSHHPILIAATSVLGAIAVASTSLLIWKLLSNPDNPTSPADVEYIDNFIKESEYAINSEDKKTLLNETIREYDKNWCVVKEKINRYNPTGALSAINTDTTEYDEKYRVTRKYQENAKADGTISEVHSVDYKYDTQGRIVEQINLHADGPISSATNINISKMTANFVDDENYVRREETYLNDVLIHEKDIESHSTIGDNEKTLTAVARSAEYNQTTGDLQEEENLESVILMKYDNLGRLAFSQQKDTSTLERGSETGSSNKEYTISYVYDSDDDLSYQFEESTKEETIYEGEKTSLETSKKGYQKVIDSQVERLYQVTDKSHPLIPFDTYFAKEIVLYDDLDREVSKKAYIDVGFMSQNSFNTEHAWLPLKSVYTSYIGKTNKILSTLIFDVDYSNPSKIKYTISDSTRKMDKYNRWVSDDIATYQIGGTTPRSDLTYVEREYAEPVPVNPDIPQPEEE